MVKYLIFSFLQINTDTFANSVDPEEMARNEPSHQDLHCLPFYLIFHLTLIFINGCVSIQRRMSPLQPRYCIGVSMIFFFFFFFFFLCCCCFCLSLSLSLSLSLLSYFILFIILPMKICNYNISCNVGKCIF